MSEQIPISTRIHGDIQVFHFHFADFEDFNWPALQEGAVCSWRLYGMTYVGLRVLEFRPNRIRFAQEFREIFRFFISISPILLILRISTGQRFRKERFVNEACMGWIMDGLESLNTVHTESDSHKNSSRYSDFSFPFFWFCWFCAFQQASASGRSGLFMTLVWDLF